MEANQTIDVGAAWHELGDRLRVYVSRRVNPGDADDVVQSVMVKLLERRGDIGAHSVRAWLFTVTRNAIAEYYRRQRPSVDLDTFGDLAEGDVADPADRTIGDLSDCLDPMLRMLPESDAVVLRRIDLEGRRTPPSPSPSASRCRRSSRASSARGRSCAPPSTPAARSTWPATVHRSRSSAAPHALPRAAATRIALRPAVEGGAQAALRPVPAEQFLRGTDDFSVDQQSN
jgi:RNA polymerase sigma factor (sigma-70 family)